MMPYTTALSAIVIDDINGAMRQGMSLEKCYIEMLNITRELQQRIVEQHVKHQEDTACFTD